MYYEHMVLYMSMVSSFVFFTNNNNPFQAIRKQYLIRWTNHVTWHTVHFTKHTKLWSQVWKKTQMLKQLYRLYNWIDDANPTLHTEWLHQPGNGNLNNHTCHIFTFNQKTNIINGNTCNVTRSLKLHLGPYLHAAFLILALFLSLAFFNSLLLVMASSSTMHHSVDFMLVHSGFA